MSVNTIVERCLQDIPKAVAAGVFDTGSGMLIGAKTGARCPQDALDRMAAATKDLYEGDDIANIEKAFKKSRGMTSDERYFQEIIVTSKDLLHIFARLRSNQAIVACVVCLIGRADADVALTLSKARAIFSAEII